VVRPRRGNAGVPSLPKLERAGESAYSTQKPSNLYPCRVGLGCQAIFSQTLPRLYPFRQARAVVAIASEGCSVMVERCNMLHAPASHAWIFASRAAERHEKSRIVPENRIRDFLRVRKWINRADARGSWSACFPNAWRERMCKTPIRWRPPESPQCVGLVEQMRRQTSLLTNAVLGA